MPLAWMIAERPPGLSRHDRHRPAGWRRGSIPPGPHIPIHRITRIIRHAPDLAVAEVHLPLLFQGQRPRADAAEDGDLVTALIDGAVAVEGAGHRVAFAAVRDRVRRDQVRGRPGAEAGI